MAVARTGGHRQRQDGDDVKIEKWDDKANDGKGGWIDTGLNVAGGAGMLMQSRMQQAEAMGMAMFTSALEHDAAMTKMLINGAKGASSTMDQIN